MQLEDQERQREWRGGQGASIKSSLSVDALDCAIAPTETVNPKRFDFDPYEVH
ncbi:hypothetical protein [Spirulina subsalsa]|uniref:hypothetical protein n=1 Tax=Spirulina subsalsa TaxID=54311 RepID=UPI0002F42AA4|nr:hypothetical protein [Spirulina subsalsa]